jgi:3-oxoadipate enol-lactonase
MPSIILKEIELAYEDVGKGKTILFIHGYLVNRLMWKPQIEDLSQHYRVIAPDLRGHGESSSANPPYTMEQLADDCFSLLKTLKVDQPVFVCGLSMGGYVSLAFARKYASKVAGLILSSTRSGMDSPETKIIREKSAEMVMQDGLSTVIEPLLAKLLAPQNYHQMEFIVTEVRQMMQGTSINGVRGSLLGMRDRPGSGEFLKTFKLPTLIIHGACDQLAPLSEAELTKSYLPHASLEIIPTAGHLPNLEQPQIFNKIIKTFIDKNDIQ